MDGALPPEDEGSWEKWLFGGCAVVAAGAVAVEWTKRHRHKAAAAAAGANGGGAGASGQDLTGTWTFKDTVSEKFGAVPVKSGTRTIGSVDWTWDAGVDRYAVGSLEESFRLNEVAVIERRAGVLTTIATAPHRYRPSKLMFSRDPNIFFTASDTIYKWDLRKTELAGEPLRKLWKPPGGVSENWDCRSSAPISCFDLNIESDQKLVAGHTEGRCLLWDTAAGDVLRGDVPREVRCSEILSKRDGVYDVVFANLRQGQQGGASPTATTAGHQLCSVGEASGNIAAEWGKRLF